MYLHLLSIWANYCIFEFLKIAWGYEKGKNFVTSAEDFYP